MRGGEGHDDAVEQLDDARAEQARMRRAAEEARETAGESAADADLAHAEHRAAGQEAWLTWIERGF
jgi:hypothetical protein